MSVAGHPGRVSDLRTGPDRPPDAADRAAPGGLAACLIGIGVLGILGAAAQLALPGPRHPLPWVATALLVAAATLLALPRAGRPGRRVARALSLVVLVSAATAVADHLSAGPGGAVGAVTLSWYGGGAHSLAPGLLGQSALLLLAASARPGPRMRRLARRVLGGGLYG